MSRQHRRCYCLLPEEANPEAARNLHCGVGGHSHLNFTELYGAVDYVAASREIAQLGAKYLGRDGLLERAEVEWLCFPRVLRLRREPEKAKQQSVQLKGLSCKVGPYLAEQLRRLPEGTWPHVMFAEMRGQRETRETEASR